ncbi:MAG: hypothetical protein ACR2NZ_17755, partial [Rubripirellula sp.]
MLVTEMTPSALPHFHATNVSMDAVDSFEEKPLSVDVMKRTDEVWTYGDGVDGTVLSRAGANSARESDETPNDGNLLLCVMAPPITELPSHVVQACSTDHVACPGRDNAKSFVIDASHPALNPRSTRGSIQLQFSQRGCKHPDAVTLNDAERTDELTEAWTLNASVMNVGLGNSRTLPPAALIGIKHSGVHHLREGVAVAGINSARSHDHNAILIAPHFSGSRCTTSLVPQFLNVAAYSSISKSRLSKCCGQTQVLANARLDSPLPTNTHIVGGRLTANAAIREMNAFRSTT